MSPIAFLFPGQGAQRPGMLARLRSDAITAATCAEAEDFLGRDLDSVDSAAALAGTEATQLALLIAAVADARALQAAGIHADFVAGHSVGAFAAAVCAGALEFGDALRLVAVRGQAMAQAQGQGFGMAAIVGIPERSLQQWIAAATERGAVLFLTNRNAARQFAVSGADADLENLIAHARQNGARSAVRLAVAVPSHSPLMHSVPPRMREAMSRITLRAPRVPFASNHSARLVRDAAGVAEDLIENVVHPVRWYEIQQALYERGVRTFIEMRPGDVLSKLAEVALGEVRAFALESTSPDGLRGIVQTRSN